MTGYIAFLRGINVGGHKIVKMEDLNAVFLSCGLKKVKTFIQSGNVIFEASSTNSSTLTKKIEKSLQKSLGYDVPVLLRTISELAELVKSDPFKKIKVAADAGKYVTFLAEEPKSKPSLPFFSPKKDVEVFYMRGLDIFCLAYKIDGKSGFPNAIVEKQFGVSATTRNWNTISKIVLQAAERD
ncbi:MAG TPA: DUF1697 domain-containing protein [Blastocatellia bacterium]|nr:DUF1697 domain-containing protein [Blastocatellia bacterium]